MKSLAHSSTAASGVRNLAAHRQAATDQEATARKAAQRRMLKLSRPTLRRTRYLASSLATTLFQVWELAAPSSALAP
eukprot:CAMPEP_0204088142 /NCGR_PEP_ID=MMETSP0360-20130528/185766_1 /ASSEMBLY_ACC=CAM_ASM_000342 /TAXON_ID=268821 /ORGANISM="Scrippsiella Hangoei, Strain SHTV-5" /LENGTH=76 /DNA_ID=CAMNT_0051037315 /DNA_START=75 /DNA_END=302 /DNA_ORIENTATION=+